ncbi:MAG: hypothetical protein DMD44_10370 [Gemmatimonadetes bacterium]|nr:MAG: hypothetical protein DMD44_10370 [Gemmatimonadota bacterium]
MGHRKAAPPPVLWDDGYEATAPRARLVRRLALGAGVVSVLAGAALSGVRLAGRSATPAPELVTPPPTPPPSSPPQAAPVAAAPVEPAPPRDTAPPLPPPRPRRPAVVAAGRLFVGATPWGELHIDGRLIGHTPIAALVIAAGWHQVRIVRDGFAPFEQRIQVAPGADVRLTGVVLQPFHL